MFRLTPVAGIKHSIREGHKVLLISVELSCKTPHSRQKGCWQGETVKVGAVVSNFIEHLAHNAISSLAMDI